MDKIGLLTSSSPVNPSVFFSKEKKITPGRKQQRHSTEIGSEYHRWWAVRSCLGFQTNEQIAGLLLDGFYALLEHVVTSAGGKTGEHCQYYDGIDHHTEIIWRMCRQPDVWLKRIAYASPALRAFLERLISYLRYAKGRGFSLNYRKKKMSGKVSSILPIGNHRPHDLHLFPSFTPDFLGPDGSFGPMPTASYPMFPGSDHGSISTSIQPNMASSHSSTVQVNLADSIERQSAIDATFPPIPPYNTTPFDNIGLASSSSRRGHSTNTAAMVTKQCPDTKQPRQLLQVLNGQQTPDDTRLRLQSFSGGNPIRLESKPHDNVDTVGEASQGVYSQTSPNRQDATADAQQQATSVWDRIKSNEVHFLDHRTKRELKSDPTGPDPDPSHSGKKSTGEKTKILPAASTTEETSQSNCTQLDSSNIFSTSSSSHKAFQGDRAPVSFITQPSHGCRLPIHQHAKTQSTGSAKTAPTTSSLATSWLLYPSPSLPPQDNSLASLSSLVQNIVYNSQGSILKPLSSVQRESREKTLLAQSPSDILGHPKDHRVSQTKASSSQIHLVAPSLSAGSGVKTNVLPLFIAPPMNLPPRFTFPSSDVALTSNMTPVNTLPSTSLSVRQDNSMMVNFSVYKMSQDLSGTASQPTQGHNVALPSSNNYISPDDCDIKIRDVRSCHKDEHMQMDDSPVDQRIQTQNSSKIEMEKQAQKLYCCYDLKPSMTSLSSHQSNGFLGQRNSRKDNTSNSTYENIFYEDRSTMRPFSSSIGNHIPPNNKYSSPQTLMPSMVSNNYIGGYVLPGTSYGNDPVLNKTKMLPSLLKGETYYGHNTSSATSTWKASSHGTSPSISYDQNDLRHHDTKYLPSPTSLAVLGQSSYDPPFMSTALTRQAHCHNAPILSTSAPNRSSEGTPSARRDRSELCKENAAPTSNSSDSRLAKKPSSSKADEGHKHGASKRSSKNSSRSSTCHTCALVFCSPTDLLVHRYELHSFVCGECDGRFLSEARLQQHKDADHPQMKKCPSCRFVYFSNEAMTKHMWCEHGLKSDGTHRTKGRPLESLNKDGKESSMVKTKSNSVEADEDHEEDKIEQDVRQEESNNDNNTDFSSKRQSASPESRPDPVAVNISSPQAPSLASKPFENSPDEASPRPRKLPETKPRRDAIESNATFVDAGPVFPSFRKEVVGMSTSTSAQQSVVDMYSQVNQHCHLDSTDFLFHSTARSAPATSSSHELNGGEFVGDEEDESDSMRSEHERSGTDHIEAEPQPLCLVMHQRNSQSDKEGLWLSRNRNDSKRGVHAKKRRRAEQMRLARRNRGHAADEKGDRIVRRASIDNLDGNSALKKRKVSETNSDKNATKNVDQNCFLSMRSVRSRDSRKRRKQRANKEPFVIETPGVLDEPCLEIDYAEDSTSASFSVPSFYESGEIPMTTVKQEISTQTAHAHNIVPRNSSFFLGAPSLVHPRKRIAALIPEYENNESQSGPAAAVFKKGVSSTSNSRLASLRDRDRYRSNQLPPKKRSFRKSTRAANSSNNFDSFDFEKIENESEDGLSQTSRPNNQQLEPQQQTSVANTKSAGEKQRFHCPYQGCPSTFSRRWTMDCHIRKIHDGRFMCEYEGCKTTCESKSDLRQHMSSSHNGKDRKRRCRRPGCSEVFLNHGQLRVHSLTHTHSHSTGEKSSSNDMKEVRCEQDGRMMWQRKRNQHNEQWSNSSV